MNIKKKFSTKKLKFVYYFTNYQWEILTSDMPGKTTIVIHIKYPVNYSGPQYCARQRGYKHNAISHKAFWFGTSRENSQYFDSGNISHEE